MKFFFFLVTIIVFNSRETLAQIGESIVKNKLQQADSILIVSHTDTKGVIILDSSGNEVPLPSLLINNKPNYQIFKERKTLNNNEKLSLINIMRLPFRDREIISGGCFNLHHTIFIFKNGETSFIDICFTCSGFETSPDLKQLYAFDKKKWTELREFFKKLGFNFDFLINEN